MEHIRYFFEDALRTTPTFLAPPGYISVEQLKIRAALPTSCMAGSISMRSTSRSSSRSARPIGRRADRRMGRADGDQPFHHSRRDRQHAALEGGEELTLIAEDVIPRCARRRADERRVAAE